MAIQCTPLEVAKGKTFERVLRWGSLPFIYKPITGITQTAPAVVSAVAHGIPDGWRVAVVSVQGMREINAVNLPPRAKDFIKATVAGANAVELNSVNAAGFSAYTSGGYLQFYTPVSLEGALARMTIKDKIGGTALLAMDSALLGGIVLDNTAKTITITISATDTAALTWRSGVYDLEVQLQSGTVKLLMQGSVSVSTEVTT